MKFIEYENFRYIIGENALDNWKILELCDGEDLWMHMDGIPSPYVIIKENPMIKDKDNIKNAINYGANLCKENTSKKYITGKLKVVYTEIKNIKKGKKVGEIKINNNPRYIKV